MKIYTNDQIRAIDAGTIRREGIAGIELVERAAEGIAREIMARWRPNKRIVVFAGPGNNGADALATARILMEQAYMPEVYLFNIGGNRLHPDCRESRDRFLAAGGSKFTEVIKNFERPMLGPDDLVIDGLFGTGLKSPLPSSGYVSVIQMINESGATIVSIDIPSGMFGDWNTEAINRNIINASLTLTLQFPRLAFFLSDNDQLVGNWKVIDINLSREEMRAQKAQFYLVQQQDIKSLLHPRKKFVSKADFGSAIIYAGSYGMTGAAVLAAKGASRSGAGKVTVHSPRCAFYVLQSTVPSAMYEADPDNSTISDFTLRKDYKGIAIGPGIGTSDNTVNALESCLKVANANSRPLILDADALNCIAMRPSMLNYIPVLSIITPHAGEFDRLFGEHASAESRLRKAIEVAAYHRILIILKGRYTAIVRPDGKVYFNSSGTPAMATAGSGDVLTGLLAGLLAQGYNPEIAALLGCFIHGLAGEMAEAVEGEYGVTADDIAANIGRAIKTIME